MVTKQTPIEIIAKGVTSWLGYSWDDLSEGSVTEKGLPVFTYGQSGWTFQGRKDDMLDLGRELLEAAIPVESEPAAYLREPGLRALAEGDHTLAMPVPSPAELYTIPVYLHPARSVAEKASLESKLVGALDVLREVRRHVSENLTRMHGHDEFGEIRRIDAALSSSTPVPTKSLERQLAELRAELDIAEAKRVSLAAVVQEAREIVDAIAGENRPAREWAVRVRKSIDAALSSSIPATADPDEETYEIGKRDGYSEAVQEIDRLTGGDGEYRYCADHDPDRHTPDPAAMIQRIVDRFETPNNLDEAIKSAGCVPAAQNTLAEERPGNSETPQEAFGRWLSDGPRLAKEVGIYVGIKVTQASSIVKEAGK